MITPLGFFFFKLKVRKGGLQLFERKRQCSFNPDPLNPVNVHVSAALGLLWALLNDVSVFLQSHRICPQKKKQLNLHFRVVRSLCF